MSDFSSRVQGAVLGSFAADALSLGVHWIYDSAELFKKQGRVVDFHAPGGESYHPKKQAGDQSHVGDQALRLMSFLKREKRWDRAAFFQDWLAMWEGYEDYFDHATKEVIANQRPADSNELAGPARIAPLIAFFADESEDDAVFAAKEQTDLTHRSSSVTEATDFLATATHRLIGGADLLTTIEETAPAWAWNKAGNVLDQDAVAAIDVLGQSCPIPAALPSVIYLIRKFGQDLETAFIENAMAGGDNCARGLALGMLLGAAHGSEAIPKRWRDGLNAAL